MSVRKSIVWRIFPQYLILILLALFAVTLVSNHALKNLYVQRTLADLEGRSRLIARLLLSEELIPLKTVSLNRRIDDLADELGIRITVILPDGSIAADSHENYQFMDNHLDRPEIREAFKGRTGSISRYSYTLKTEMLYVAVPVIVHEKCIAVVRTSMPSASLLQTLRHIYLQILLTALISVVIAGLIGYYYFNSINKPLHTIRKGASLIGSGRLDHRIFLDKPEELKILADSINQMAVQLNERIDLITKQRNELEAVLSSMVEAVLVVDTEERVIRINHALSDLFQIDSESSIGKNIQETLRNISLQRFVQKTLNSDFPQEEELNIMQEKERTVQAHGTPLLDSAGKKIGVLIVLNDITRQKILENIRREFVANVSHELKTPITAIQGFIETLREGTVHDKKKVKEFLDIIHKHSTRLDGITEDLLNLSRIEQDAEKNAVLLTPGEISSVIEEAVSFSRTLAAEKKIGLKPAAASGLCAKMNAPLLEQALVNLIENAVKYSPEKSIVSVTARKQNEKILIEVSDQGCGIPEKDIPRIFERFYRVDKARSRDSGGTGLGLSIVKHIAEAHGGQISVISRLGQGSTFTMSLPLMKRPQPEN